MISFTVRMRFEDADPAFLTESLHQLTVASRQEPGCVYYIAHLAESDPATVVIYEQYVDEAALEHHRNTPHFLRYAQNGLYQLQHTRALEMLNVID